MPVWKGVLGKAVGGHCTIGQVTLFHPNWTALIAAQHQVRRSTQVVSKKCNPTVTFWNTAECISASLIPAIGTAHALASLSKFGCWLAKDANATSATLSATLINIKSVWCATLQNRAAIDFLLLAQGHGCKDFDDVLHERKWSFSDHTLGSSLNSYSNVMSNMKPTTSALGHGLNA